MIIIEKVKKKMLFKSIMDTTISIKVVRISSLIDLAGRYIWVISNIDVNIVKK